MAKMRNGTLGLISVALTMQKDPEFLWEILIKIKGEMEEILVQDNYYDGCPFSGITLSLRLGLKDDEKPVYFRINKKYEDLSLAIEVDCSSFMEASREEIHDKLRNAVLISLLDAGKKYSRPMKLLSQYQTKYVRQVRVNKIPMSSQVISRMMNEEEICTCVKNAIVLMARIGFGIWIIDDDEEGSISLRTMLPLETLRALDRAFGAKKIAFKDNPDYYNVVCNNSDVIVTYADGKDNFSMTFPRFDKEFMK
jgi:hypothetical protein